MTRGGRGVRGQVHRPTGGSESRARRSQARVNSEQDIGRGLRINQRTGKQEIDPAPRVAKLPATATLPELVEAFNKLIDSQTGSGQMEA